MERHGNNACAATAHESQSTLGEEEDLRLELEDSHVQEASLGFDYNIHTTTPLNLRARLKCRFIFEV